MSSHAVTVTPRNDGPFRKHQAKCATCGPITEWTTDGEDARRVGRRHEAAMAADVVAGVEGS